MEFNIEKWLNEISLKIKEHFKGRVLFIGYHGSYRRAEATVDSDIDMVVILDKLDLEDLKEYKKIVQTMPHSEKACGFISGKKEIENWSKSDVFQFAYETEALYGELSEIITPLNIDDVKLAVKTGAENLYHSACHSFLYDKDLKQSLKNLYKMTFFILQAQYFLQNKKYVLTKNELINLLSGEDKIILENCINSARISEVSESEINELYDILIKWCSDKIL